MLVCVISVRGGKVAEFGWRAGRSRGMNAGYLLHQYTRVARRRARLNK